MYLQSTINQTSPVGLCTVCGFGEFDEQLSFCVVQAGWQDDIKREVQIASLRRIAPQWHALIGDPMRGAVL